MTQDELRKGKPGVCVLVDLPPREYLCIQGQGAPEGEVYAISVAALYALAYTARFAGKVQGFDEKVGPLEGLWWADDHDDFHNGRRERWLWQMMIAAPSWVNAKALSEIRAQVLRKKAREVDLCAAVERVHLITLDEGTCVQALHVGPYRDEAPLIARMHAHAAEQGFELTGKHHEIYLSDPRRVAPEKLKTVLRQPLRKTA